MTWGDDFLSCELIQFKSYHRPKRKEHPLARIGVIGHGASLMSVIDRVAQRGQCFMDIDIVDHYEDIDIWSSDAPKNIIEARPIDMHRYSNLDLPASIITTMSPQEENAKRRSCNNAQRKNKRKKKVKPKRKRK